MARGLLNPMVNKNSKIKIAALETLTNVLRCGVWKKNNDIMEILIGYRDPNYIAILDFYEPSTKLNYFALFINDPKVNVREMFIRTLGDWMIYLPGNPLPRFIF